MTHEKNITRLVGAYLSQPLVDYLNLYAFACERSKSDLLRDAFEKWYEIRSAALSTDVLKNNIRAKLQEKWMMYSLDLLDKNPCELGDIFRSFKVKNKIDLLKKLPIHVAEEIINDLEL